MNCSQLKIDKIAYKFITNFTVHLGALSSLLGSLAEVLAGDFVVSRMLKNQIELMNGLAEIDYLVLDVFEPVLSEEDGTVASAGNNGDFKSPNDVSEIFTGSNPISDDDIH